MSILVPQGSPFQEETLELKAERLAEEKSWHEEMGRLIEGGYITRENEPLKCTECDSVDLEDVNKDIWAGHLMSYDCRCKNCGVRLGSWDTGSWNY